MMQEKDLLTVIAAVLMAGEAKELAVDQLRTSTAECKIIRGRVKDYAYLAADLLDQVKTLIDLHEEYEPEGEVAPSA